MNETRELARWVTRLKFSDLPEDVVDFTKRFLLDDIGCILGGALQFGNIALMRHVLALDEKPECTIAVYGHKTSPTNAALMNGAFLCGWDYDNMAEGGVHMGSQTVTMIAMAERELITGKEMILAECAGIEAQCRIGIASGGVGTKLPRPWHANTTLGPFASAVTTGKILGFNEKEMEDAISIATQILGGNYQHYNGWGSSLKRIRCGIGAWNGMRAALLVNEGLTGPKEALEGSKGYLEAMHGKLEDGTLLYNPSLITEDLGNKWYTRTYCSKSGACLCCSANGSALETALTIKREDDFKLDEIKSIKVEFADFHSYNEVNQNLGTMLGMTPLQRLGTSGWSIRWLIALTLVAGRPTIRTQLRNIRPYGRYKEIEELSKKVETNVNEKYFKDHFKDRPYPSQGGYVIIRLKDDRVLEHEPLPYLGQRMSDGTVYLHKPEQLEEKMREQAVVAGISREKQDRIIDIIAYMEDQNNILELISNIVR